ncbi:MAG: DUF5916 domain-containing protein [Leadbetterella sp.]
MTKSLVLIAVLFSTFSHAQNFQENYKFYGKKTKTSIKVDGDLTAEEWSGAQSVGDFWEKFPNDKSKAELKTEVKCVFDDQFIYFAIWCFDSLNTYVAPSLKRDLSIREADGIAVILDPINKKSSGFGFSVTPFNVQTEYLIGGSSDGNSLNTAWDNKWFSGAKRDPKGYYIEMAIPFKTLRYDANNNVWGVNIIRADQKKYKFYTWTHVPVQFPGFDLGYTGSLHLEGQLPKTKKNYAIIPYLTGGVNKERSESSNFTGGVGFDAKLSLSSSLNMDFTLLPDFSQVDVDQQVTNLTRFSIFFPERRTFFLENDDVFSGYGNPPIQPFFSRRIGIDKDNNPIPILFGAKLSGNITEKLRIGVFNMQTASTSDAAAQNFTALSMIQRVGARSNIKAYVHNISTDITDAESDKDPLAKFGRNAGLEYSYSSASGKWTGWAGGHFSFKPNVTGKNQFLIGGFRYSSNKFEFLTDLNDVGDNYYADMGFVNRIETSSTTGDTYDSDEIIYRNGFKQSYSEFNYRIRPKSGKIALHGFELNNYVNWFQDGKRNEWSNGLVYYMNFKNSSNFNAELSYSDEYLKYYFPLPDKKPLRPGSYRYLNAELNYVSDTRKNFFIGGGFQSGGFYNAYLNQLSLDLTIRKQPFWTFSLNSEYNHIQFPDEYGTTVLLLFSPKTEINFSNKTFWTTFVQFNTQGNNLNINSRLQYRYSPMSDFFLVYSDNYFTNPLFKNKNRGLVFKLNYWIS